MSILFYQLYKKGLKVVTPPVEYKDSEKLHFYDIVYHVSIFPISVFTRHQYFIDFESHDFPAPVYMNLIRDPVDRFASFYYFSRYGNARSGLKKAPPNHMTLDVWNESLDECVANHRRECISPIWHTVPYRLRKTRQN